jgi:putative SOS response-associated peptidase YedK
VCGKSKLEATWDEIVRLYQLLPPDVPEVEARTQIFPTQPQVTIRLSPQGRQLSLMAWGLIPSWWNQPKPPSKTFNARIEGIDQKPSFRTPFRKRRCLIIIDGYYEWKYEPGVKQGIPHLIRLADQTPFATAGLWDSWQPPSGEAVESCTMITKPAAGAIVQVHHRMPVVLPKQDFDMWLDPNYQHTATLLSMLEQAPVPAYTLQPMAVVRSIKEKVKPAPTKSEEQQVQLSLLG